LLVVIEFVIYYTRCTKRNVTYFGRTFLRLNYIAVAKNTDIQSYLATEIMPGIFKELELLLITKCI